MTYTREDILNKQFDINLMHDIPCEIGEIYTDPTGIYEILDITGDDVKIQEVTTGQIYEGVQLKEVRFFCRYGLQDADRPWYAAMRDLNDRDWGYGSYDLDEAKKMARDLGEEAYISRSSKRVMTRSAWMRSCRKTSEGRAGEEKRREMM